MILFLYFSKSYIFSFFNKVEPKSVIITSNNNDNKSLVRLTSNVSTVIECVAEGSNPGCDINWYLGKTKTKNKKLLNSIIRFYDFICLFLRFGSA